MLGKIIAIICLILTLLKANLTLQEYEQLEIENPQNLFELRKLQDYKEYYPNINKLVFLTPWNIKGYQYTIKYAHKIKYVSPCWYSFQIDSQSVPIFQNQYNYNVEYATNIKIANPNIKLVPRLYLQPSNSNFFQAIGSNKHNFQKALSLIKRIVQEKQLDGIVWDTPYNFFEKSRNSLNMFIVEFVNAIKKTLGKDKLVLFNMGNPKDHMNTLDIQLYDMLKVDVLLIQNYDKGDKYIEMIQKSIQWTTKLKSKPRFMMMLPFFTVKLGVGSISTEDAQKSLQKYGVSHSQIKDHFCKFTQNKSRKVYYIPCYAYFKKAFSLIESVNMEVGFWEGGNGIESYYLFL